MSYLTELRTVRQQTGVKVGAFVEKINEKARSIDPDARGWSRSTLVSAETANRPVSAELTNVMLMVLSDLLGRPVDLSELGPTDEKPVMSTVPDYPPKQPKGPSGPSQPKGPTSPKRDVGVAA